MGRMSCLYSRTPFLTERSLFLFRSGPGGTHLRFFNGFTHEKDSQALILMPGWLYPRGRGLKSRRRFRCTVCPVRKVSIDGGSVGDVCECGVQMEWHRQAADPVPVPLWPPGKRTKVGLQCCHRTDEELTCRCSVCENRAVLGSWVYISARHRLSWLLKCCDATCRLFTDILQSLNIVLHFQ